MLSSRCLQQMIFEFSKTKKLSKRSISHYFNKKQQNFQAAKDKLQKNFQIGVNMTPKQAIYWFNENPKMFVENTRANKIFQERVNFLKNLKQNNSKMAEAMLKAMYKSSHVFDMTEKQLQDICHCVQKQYQFSPTQVESAFIPYHRIINPKLPTMLADKTKILQEYLNLSRPQAVEFLAKHPFIIPASALRIKQTIVLFLSTTKFLRNDEIMNRQKVLNLFSQFPEILLLGRHQIKDLLTFYRGWGVSDQQLWDVILKNPVLLNNYPYEIMPLKRKLFRYFKFTTQMGKQMLTKYPLSLIGSVSSLEAKLIFIRDRLKLPININILPLLQYKFSTIRPRGQILVRIKEPFTIQNIVDWMKMSDSQFAKKLQVPQQRLIEQKERFKETDELDFRRKKVLIGSNTQQKVTQYVNEMRATML